MQNINLMDIITLLISIISLLIAIYAVYVGRVAAENQILNSILTNLTQQTNSMENFINDLLAKAAIKDGLVVIDINHWSFILTPIIKSKQLFEMYEKEYSGKLTPKQFQLIMKTFYIQIPQLIKMRINQDSVNREFSLINNKEVKETLLAQLKDSRHFVALANES